MSRLFRFSFRFFFFPSCFPCLRVGVFFVSCFFVSFLPPSPTSRILVCLPTAPWTPGQQTALIPIPIPIPVLEKTRKFDTMRRRVARHPRVGFHQRYYESSARGTRDDRSATSHPSPRFHTGFPMACCVVPVAVQGRSQGQGQAPSTCHTTPLDLAPPIHPPSLGTLNAKAKAQPHKVKG